MEQDDDDDDGDAVEDNVLMSLMMSLMMMMMMMMVMMMMMMMMMGGGVDEDEEDDNGNDDDDDLKIYSASFKVCFEQLLHTASLGCLFPGHYMCQGNSQPRKIKQKSILIVQRGSMRRTDCSRCMSPAGDYEQ